MWGQAVIGKACRGESVRGYDRTQRRCNVASDHIFSFFFALSRWPETLLAGFSSF